MKENRPSLQEDIPHWKDIELFLKDNPKGKNVYEIAGKLNVHWVTAQRQLEKLEKIGRLHSEKYGNTIVYFLNGVDQWKTRIDLSSNHCLFIDTFRTQFGDNFVRIKESKKIDGAWKSMGNIMITRDTISDVRNFLGVVEENIGSIKK